MFGNRFFEISPHRRAKTRKIRKNRKLLLAIYRTVCYYNKAVYLDNFSKEVQHKMAKCEFCDKGVAFGIQVSHSHRRSNRTWKPNVKRVKAIVDGTPRHVYVCTRCLRSGKVTRAV
jgi:large subunit ribosomal protein L28